MYDLMMFIAGGLYVFVVAFLVAFIEHLKDESKGKNHDK
jgi:hypothetical protein